jgi:hypothetical protein
MAMVYTAMSRDRETGVLATSLHTATHDHTPAFEEVQVELSPGRELLFLARGQVVTVSGDSG